MERMDWTHQWENFEMFMYVVPPEEGDPGIFMQVLRRELQDRAEQWDMLYDRKIAELEPADLSPVEEIDTASSDDLSVRAALPGSEAWEERILRRQMQQNPNLVDEEKIYLRDFLEQS